MDSPSDYVIVTQYTTVYPTSLAQASTASAIISSASQMLTTVVSSKVRLSSTAPASTFSTLISSSSAVASMSTSSTTSILSSSSTTGAPTGVPAAAPVGSKHQFNDTSIGIFAAAFAVLGLLLLVTVCYMIYLRFKGKCPRCNDMEKQLEKWQSGELKRITPEMVRKRETLNKSASSSNASSDLEIEMTTFGGATAARSAVLDQPKPTKQPSFWDKAKSKFFYIRKEEVPAGDLESSPETPDIQYANNLDATHNDADPSYCVSLERPQPPIASERPQSPIEYEQNLNHLYQQRASAYTYASNYSQPEASQPDDAHGSRVFTDYAPTITSQRRGPLRKEEDEPSRYTAFGMAEKQERLKAAKEALQSDEYKRAESIIKRGSAPDYELRRALSLVNFADQSYNMARTPSLYMQSSTPTDAVGPAQVEQYEMPEWRKKGNKAPMSDED